jgi:hypothetical protein
MAPADFGIVGELADGWLDGLLALLPDQLAPRRRRNGPGAVPDVRGLFYPVCVEVVRRYRLQVTERPMAVDGLWSSRILRRGAVRRGGQLTVQLWHPPAR